jgi:hypothetical protein
LNKDTAIGAGWNVLFAVSAASVAYGFWLAWRPLGFIFGGLLVGVLSYGGGVEHMRSGRGR